MVYCIWSHCHETYFKDQQLKRFSEHIWTIIWLSYVNVFIYLNTDSVQDSLFEPVSEELIVNVKGPFPTGMLRNRSVLSLIWSLMWSSLIFHIAEVMSLCCISFASIPRCCVSSGSRQIRCFHLEVRSMIHPVIPVIPQIHFNPSRLPLDDMLRMPGTDFQRSYHSSYAVQVAHICLARGTDCGWLHFD